MIKNNITGRLKKLFGKYKDKTETNRKIDTKKIEDDLKELYGKKDKLSQEQFNDFYTSRIMPKIISLSQILMNITLNSHSYKMAKC